MPCAEHCLRLHLQEWLRACVRAPLSVPYVHPEEALALAAVGTAPWHVGAQGWQALCPASAPCDTVVVDPRVAFAPRARQSIWIPHNDSTLFLLTGTDGSSAQARQPVIRLGEWRACLTAMEARPRGGPVNACAAVAFPDAVGSSTDSVLVFVTAVTPASGMSWSQIVIHKGPDGVWMGRVRSFWAE